MGVVPPPNVTFDHPEYSLNILKQSQCIWSTVAGEDAPVRGAD